jgi:hypothetical protein
MIGVPLTRGGVALIDDEDAHFMDFKWYCGFTGYARRNLNIGKRNSVTINLHHAIMGVPLHEKEVDHINGNRLDNRKENLRIVTRRENQQNKKHNRQNNTVGTTFNKRLNKFVAQIWANGRRRHLGVFNSEQEASRAYWHAVNTLT